MSKHTPGPWKVFLDGVKTVCGRPGMDRSQLMPVVLLGLGCNKEANARLIAAAPDLLAACEAVIEYMKYGQFEKAVEVCKAAIDKAKGKS